MTSAVDTARVLGITKPREELKARRAANERERLLGLARTAFARHDEVQKLYQQATAPRPDGGARLGRIMRAPAPVPMFAFGSDLEGNFGGNPYLSDTSVAGRREDDPLLDGYGFFARPPEELPPPTSVIGLAPGEEPWSGGEYAPAEVNPIIPAQYEDMPDWGRAPSPWSLYEPPPPDYQTEQDKRESLAEKWIQDYVNQPEFQAGLNEERQREFARSSDVLSPYAAEELTQKYGYAAEAMEPGTLKRLGYTNLGGNLVYSPRDEEVGMHALEVLDALSSIKAATGGTIDPGDWAVVKDIPLMADTLDMLLSPGSIATFGAGFWASAAEHGLVAALKIVAANALKRGIPTAALSALGGDVGEEVAGEPGRIVGSIAGGITGYHAPEVTRVGKNVLSNIDAAIAGSDLDSVLRNYGNVEYGSGLGNVVRGPTDVLSRLSDFQFHEPRPVFAAESLRPDNAIGPTRGVAAEDVLGLRNVEPSLRPSERLANRVKELFGGEAPNDPRVQGVIHETERVYGVVNSQAQVVKGEAAVLEDMLKINKEGEFKLPDGTRADIRDVAAKLPLYADQLGKEVVERIRKLGAEFASLRALGNRIGREIGFRADVMDGGVYLPRGRPSEDGWLGIVEERRQGPTGGSARRGAKSTSEKGAAYDSVAEGKRNGETYPGLATAVYESYRGLGRAITEQHMANEINRLIPSLTASDFLPAGIKEQFTKASQMVDRIAGRLGTAEKRAGIAETRQGEATSVLEKGVTGAKAPIRGGKAAEGLRGRADELLTEKMGRPPGSEPVRIKMPVDEGTKATAKELEKQAAKLERARPEMLDDLNAVIDRTQKRISVLRKRGGKYRDEANALQDMLDDARADVADVKPEWDAAVKRARGAHRGYRQINLTPLTGHSFEDAIADAANRWLKSIGPLEGRDAALVTIPHAVNSLIRAANATLDASFMGIQGLVGAAKDPIAYSKAMRVAIESFKDPHAFARYIERYDAGARVTGGLTAKEAARYTHIGGSETEFELRGLDRPFKYNPIRSSNRAFGAFGDVIRLELFKDTVNTGRRLGRDLDEATLSALGRAVDRTTGYTARRFGGAWGDMALFAPRFFQSQIEMLGKAAFDGTIEGAFARDGLLKLIGGGTLLTVGAKYALGQEMGADFWDPQSPNFMRVRIGDQDVSVFGPYDSLVKAVVATAQGDVSYFARTKASPLVSLAWNVIAGEGFLGDKMPKLGDWGSFADPDKLANLARTLGPFTLSEAGQKGALGTAIGLTGLKASPLSITEQRDQRAQDTTGMSLDELSKDEARLRQFKIDNSDLYEPRTDTSKEAQAYRDAAAERQKGYEDAVIAGDMTLGDYTAAQDANATQLRTQLEVLYRDAPDLKGNDPLYQSYIDLFEQAGDLNTEAGQEKFAQLEEAWLKDHPDGLRHVQEVGLVGKGPVETARRKAMAQLVNDGYWDDKSPIGYKYELATDGDRIDKGLALVQAERTPGTDYANMDRTRAVWEILTAADFTDEEIQDVLRATKGAYENKDRKAYREAHPELFVWFKPGATWELAQQLWFDYGDRP